MIFLFIKLLFSTPVYTKSGNHLEISGEGEVTANDIRTKSQYTQLESCTILNSVSSIGSGAFSGCSSLVSLELPDSLITIYSAAFEGTRLVKLKVPKNLETFIITYTFKVETFALFEVDILNNYFSAFNGCLYNKDQTILLSCPTMKKDITFPPTIKQIGIFAFWRTNVQTLNVPDSVAQINAYSFTDKGNCTSISFGSGCLLTQIPSYSFYNCYFEHIQIPSKVEELQTNAFYNCKIISFSFIENSQLKYLRDDCFVSCTLLETVDLPKSVESISMTAFSGCTSLRHISIQEGCSHYYTLDTGVILKQDNSELVFVPPNSTSLIINKETKLVETSILQKLSEVPINGVTVMPGNEFIKYDGGIFYNSDYSEAVNALGSVENVVINKQTKTLKSSLFSGISKLKTVSFAQGSICQTVERICFSNTKGLESVSFPDSITKIDEYAFDSSGIQSFTIPPLLKSLLQYTFAQCRRLTTLDAAPGSNLIGIDQCCFLNSTVSKVTLPSKLQRIGKYCFKYTQIEEIQFYSELQTIDAEAFFNSTITKITFPANSRLQKISSSAFKGTKITSLWIPKSVEIIESGAFSQCTLLETVEFETGSLLTELPTSVFEDCILLKNFPIMPSIEKIDASSFLGCFNLTQFTIIDQQKNHFVIAENGLYDTSRKALYVFPPGITSGKVIPEAIEIKGNAFYGDCLLESLIFDEGSKVETFGKDTFFKCSSIASLVLPASLKNISDGCFRSCTGLENVTFRDGSALTSIGASTFEGCKNLTNFNFGLNSKLVSIGETTFKECTKLKAIKFPSNIRLIGNSAFYDCSSLTSIEFESSNSVNLLDIPNACFAKCEQLAFVELPSFIRSIGTDAFLNCTSLNYLILHEGTEKIGDKAFMGCGLPHIDLPSSFKSIGAQSFSRCGGLRTAVVRCASGLELGSLSFAFCERLLNISFCCEDEIKADTLVFEGSNHVVLYALKSYPTDRIGGEYVRRIMDHCMVFPSIPFTVNSTFANQYGLLIASIIDSE